MSERLKEDVWLSLSSNDTYELFAMLIGHSVMNHQRIVATAKRINQALRDEIERWKYGRQDRGLLRVKGWKDPLELLSNTLSDSDFYNYFESTMKSWHDIQFRLAGKPSKFKLFPDTLMRNLREVNTNRNHLVHSEYTWQPYLRHSEEISVARPQNSSGTKNFGYVQIKTLNRDDFLQFIEYQYSIIHFLENMVFVDFQGFLYDDTYISTYSEDFDDEIVQFSDSEEVSPGYMGVKEFEDPFYPKHSEIQIYLSRRVEDLTKIDELRLQLKIKSANHQYSRIPPFEGGALDLSNATIQINR